MNSIWSQLPAPARFAIMVGGAGSLAGGLMLIVHYYDYRIALFIGIGLAVALFLIGLMVLLWKWLQKRRADSFTRGLNAEAGSAPRAINAAEQRARLDALRKKFEQGIKQFKQRGKDLYFLPWYMVAGEPGSGKTEAIRRSKIEFPIGLDDEFQGVGGTVNMNWWLTNNSVIVDTAGRLMFEDVEPGMTSEWQEFLKLLRKCRAKCPINGMILVIPANSLINDPTTAIEQKASKIARQITMIQETLDNLRFPIYVLITKCDLISGFREFMLNVDDPQLRQQILGWSNPGSLDDPFDPNQVGREFEAMVDRLKKHRLGWLQDPTFRGEATEGRRMDEVDALYALPEGLHRMVPNLKTYMERIFITHKGVWAGSALFLRGIYLSSSLQQGAVLDQQLSEALGVPLDRLGGEIWQTDRSYFLRDMFMEKIFPEKGLVTWAVNVKRAYWASKVLLLGVVFAAVMMLLAFTWWGGKSLRDSIGVHNDYWSAAQGPEQWRDLGDGVGHFRPLVSTSITGDVRFDDNPPILVGGKALSTMQFLVGVQSLADQKIEVPWVFGIARIGSDFNARRESTLKVIYDTSVLAPVLQAAHDKLARETPETWAASQIAYPAFLTLLAIETGDLQAVREVRLDILFRYVLNDVEFIRFNDAGGAAPLLKLHERFYGTTWPVWLRSGKSFSELPGFRAAVACYVATNSKLEGVTEIDAQVGAVNAFSKKLAAYAPDEEAAGRIQAIEAARTAVTSYEQEALLEAFDAAKRPLPTTTAEYEAWMTAWNAALKGLDERQEAFGRVVKTQMAAQTEASQGYAPLKAELTALNLTGDKDIATSVREKYQASVNDVQRRLFAMPLPNVVAPPANPTAEMRRELELIRSIVGVLTARLQEVQNKSFDTTSLSSDVASIQVQATRIEQQKPAFDTACVSAQKLVAEVQERRKLYGLGAQALERDAEVPKFENLAKALDTVNQETEQSRDAIRKAMPADQPLAVTAAALVDRCVLANQRKRVFIVTDGAMRLAPPTLETAAAYIKAHIPPPDPMRLGQKPDPMAAFPEDMQVAGLAPAIKDWQAVYTLISDEKLQMLNRPAVMRLWAWDGFTEWIRSYLLYWTGEGAGRFVRENAEKMGVDQSMPAIPLTAIKAKSLDAYYHPNTARLVLESGTRLIASLSQEKNGPPIPADVQALYHDSYVKGYYRYWTSPEIIRVPLDFPIEPLAWKELIKEVAGLNVQKVLSEQSAYIEPVEKALDLELGLTDEALMKERKRVRAGLEESRKTLDAAPFATACKNMLACWAELADNLPAKRKQIMAMRPAAFLGDYVIPADDQTGGVRRYWSELSYKCLERFVSEAENLADGPIQEKSRALRALCGFPIDLSMAGPDLTVAQLNEAGKLGAEILDLTNVQAKSTEPTTIGGGAATGNSRVDKLLGRVRNVPVPVFVKDGSLEGLFKQLSLLPKSAEEPFTAKMSLLGNDEQQRLLNDGQSAIRVWRGMKISQGDAGTSVRTESASDISLGEFKYPGPPLTIELYKYPDAPAADRVLTWAGPWACLKLMQDGSLKDNTGAVGVSWTQVERREEGAVWRIRFSVKDDTDTIRLFWIDVRYAKPFAPTVDWYKCRFTF